jgi:hypothetical protein
MGNLIGREIEYIDDVGRCLAGLLILKYSSVIFASMKRKIELLAPGGDIDSIKAAIIAGADAIYCGLDKFNARNRATNIALEDLNGI